MLKSFDAQAKEKFRFNLTALKQNYANIMNWEKGFFDKPTLFIRGGLSNYILPNTVNKFSLNFHKRPLLQSMEVGIGYMLKKRIL